MADQVVNYQCPNCTAPLHYVGESGKLECDFCGSKYDPAYIEQLYAKKDAAAAEQGAKAEQKLEEQQSHVEEGPDTEPQWDASGVGGQWSEEEASHLRAYSCPSCGANLVMDDTTAATSCPYCGNPTVVPAQVSGLLKPDYVIPFKLDKNAAMEALKKYYQGKKFLPKAFADTNHIEEIKGVYVPFWLFDGETDASMSFRGTIVRTYTRGDFQITDTDHYQVSRRGTVAFEKVPVDGSSKMPNAHMDAIEPFDYSELKPFSTAFLPGYMADRYDEDQEVSSKRANARISESTERALASTVAGYTTLIREHAYMHLNKGDVKYAMMPVWMLYTKWNNQNFLFAMNGQTGKLIGDLPVDKGRYWGWFGKIALPIAAILAVLLFVI